MELVREYIIKAQNSCQRAFDNIDKDDKDITVEDILKCFGDLDFLEDRLKAAKILLRLALKERMGEGENSEAN